MDKGEHAVNLRIIFVIVICCFITLWIAIMASWITGIKKGAQSYIWIKNGRVFQKLQKVKYIITEKTGILTEGRLAVTVIRPFIHISHDKLLQIAASVGSVSRHPLGSILEEEAKNRQIEILEAKDTGVQFLGNECGMEAEIEEQVFLLGSEQFIKEHGIIDKETMEMSREYVQDGKQPFILIQNKKIIGFICIEDPIRGNSKQAVGQLKKMGQEVIMVTSDTIKIARAIAKEAGIQEVYSDLSPEQKKEKVKEYMEQNQYTAMIGKEEDAIQALKEAEVGIVFKAEREKEENEADIMLQKKDLMEVVRVFQLGKDVMKLRKKNVLWSLFCNVVGILIGWTIGTKEAMILLTGIFQIMALVLIAVNCICFRKQ